MGRFLVDRKDWFFCGTLDDGQRRNVSCEPSLSRASPARIVSLARAPFVSRKGREDLPGMEEEEGVGVGLDDEVVAEDGVVSEVGEEVEVALLLFH